MNIDQWLKLIEVLVSVATPVAVVVIGALVNRNLKRMELKREILFKKKKMQKIIYDDISDKLNIIACYVADVGDYGEYTSDYIIEQKRYVDRRFKSYQSLWSKQTVDLYNQFIEACFQYCTGLGNPAKIRTQAVGKRTYFINAAKKWDTRFTENKDPEILKKYMDLTDAFVVEFVD
jgi:hypothetical protein